MLAPLQGGLSRLPIPDSHPAVSASSVPIVVPTSRAHRDYKRGACVLTAGVREAGVREAGVREAGVRTAGVHRAEWEHHLRRPSRVRCCRVLRVLRVRPMARWDERMR